MLREISEVGLGLLEDSLTLTDWELEVVGVCDSDGVRDLNDDEISCVLESVSDDDLLAEAASLESE